MDGVRVAWPELTAGVQGQAATQQIRDPHYSITLHGDWAARPGADNGQQTFYSRRLDTTAVISSLGMSASRGELGKIAHMLVELRLKAEAKAASEYKFGTTLTEPVVQSRPWGYLVAYYGSDTNGRHFAYAGVIIKSAVISVYVDSPTASENALAATMSRLMTDLEFDQG